MFKINLVSRSIPSQDISALQSKLYIIVVVQCPRVMCHVPFSKQCSVTAYIKYVSGLVKILQNEEEEKTLKSCIPTILLIKKTLGQQIPTRKVFNKFEGLRLKQ